jgi:predicted dehydrogenase
MEKIRILITGTGNMANEHVALFARDPRARVVAAVDVDQKRADAFAQVYGLEKAFSSLEEAIAWGRFDAASNVTPDGAHHATSMPLLRAGKHVLCEKPLAENFMQADEMAKEAERQGLINMVNLSYRNVAALQETRKRIAAGEIGEIRHVEASYRQSWLVGNHWGDWKTDPKWLWRLSSRHGSKGVLGDVGIHILDFATYAVGQMPVTLQARLKTFDKAPGGRIRDYDLDANDSAALMVEFGNGALGVIHTSRYMTGYGNVLKLQIFGTTGAIEITHGLAWTEMRMCSGDAVNSLAWREIIAAPTETIHHKFVSSVLSGVNAEPTFRRGADLQQVLDLCWSKKASEGLALS